MSDPTVNPEDGALNPDDLDAVAGGTFAADIHPGVDIAGRPASGATEFGVVSAACLNPQPLPP